jgi:DMSO reductase anchor subunit
MSRETLAAAIFLPAAGLDWLFPHPALRAAAAGAAVALMLCQGFIVYRARGVTAWNSALMPVLFATSGMSAGSGLALAALAFFNAFFPRIIQVVLPLPLVTVIGAMLNAVVWVIYLQTPDKGFQRATEALRRPGSLALTLGVGHLLPAILLAAALVGNVAGGTQQVVAVVAGLALIFGGVNQKFGVIISAGYLRAIALPMPPRKSATSSVEQASL